MKTELIRKTFAITGKSAPGGLPLLAIHAIILARQEIVAPDAVFAKYDLSVRLATIPLAPPIFRKDVNLSPFSMRNRANVLSVAVYSVCLLTAAAFYAQASSAAAPIRVVTDLKSADTDFPEIAPPKLPMLPAIPKLPIDLHAEAHQSENKYVLTLSVPTKVEDACHGLVANCQGAFNQVGKNALGVGQWLDNLFRTNDLSQRKAPVFITPAVSEAAKYCSRFHVCYTHEGRVKTVAPQ